MQTQFQNIIPLAPISEVASCPLTLLGQTSLHEIVPTGWKDIGAMLGFVTGAVGQAGKASQPNKTGGAAGPCLWIRSPKTERDLGQLFGPGLHDFGIDPNQVMIANARHDKDILGIMEEGLSTPALSTVIATLPANSACYDLTASRRLALRAREHGVRALLCRVGPGLAPSATHYRWQIRARPQRPSGKQAAPTFTPTWQVGLVKSKQSAPGRWVMSWNHETHSLCVDALSADGSADQAVERHA